MSESAPVTKTIREIVGKPSVAIAAMLTGLQRADAHEFGDFEIDMSTFGVSLHPTVYEPVYKVDYEKPKTCYGCAATCTLMQLFNFTFTPDNIGNSYKRACALNVDGEDLDTFEAAMDCYRMGCPEQLFKYFGVADRFDDFMTAIGWEGQTDVAPKLGIWLKTGNWKDQIPEIEKHITTLESMGL
jgi:hypothetical protein